MSRSRPDPEDLAEVWSDHLRAKGQRLTTPRRVVLEASQRVESPFTAEELLEEARRIDGLVSLPTIYRNLPLLVEAGILREARVSAETRHYANDPVGAVEMKLVCRRTGKEEAIEDDCLRLRMLLLAREKGFRVERIQLHMEGVSDG